MNHRLVFFVTSSPHSDIPSLEVHSVCFVKLTYKQINLSATEGKKKKRGEIPAGVHGEDLFLFFWQFS